MPSSQKDREKIAKQDRDDFRAGWREKKLKQLRDRLLFMLDDLAPARGKYGYLEKRTGISATRWQNLYLEKQYPTLDMLLAISEYRLCYMAWLITGTSPEDNVGRSSGQMSPPEEQLTKYLEHRDYMRATKKKKNDD